MLEKPDNSLHKCLSVMIQRNVFTPWIWCLPLRPKPLKASRWGKGRDLTKHLYRCANDQSSDKLRWKMEVKLHVWQTKQALAGLHLPQIWLKVVPMPIASHLLLPVWYRMSCFYSAFQYLAKKLGFDTLWFGYLQTTVGFIQLFGGPMFGRWGRCFRFRLASLNK